MFSRRILLDKLKLIAAHAVVGDDDQAAPSASPSLDLVAQSLNPARLSDARSINRMDVIDFGADPSGRQNSSDAIAKAVAQCFSGRDLSRPLPLFFPAGTFRIRRTNLFRSPLMTEPVLSWTIRGSGRRTTTLLFQPDGRAEPHVFYLYDGAAGEPKQTLLGLVWADMLVKLDGSLLEMPGQVHCFRQYGSHLSPAPEQNWSFSNCSFEGDFANPDRNGSILRIEGDANGSENAFLNCRALGFTHVIDCINPQALNHLSLHCHWEAICGDMFRFVRGGNLAVYGGSLILDNFGNAVEWRAQTRYPPGATVCFDGRRFRTDAGGISGTDAVTSLAPRHFDGSLDWRLVDDESMYVLRVGGDLSGQINSFLISGTRIELRTNRAKLVAGGDLNTGALITFDAIAVQPVIGGVRHSIEIAESSMSIRFQNCRINRAAGIWDEPFAVAFGPGPDPDYPSRAQGGARVILDGCQVSEALHTLSSWGAGSMGAIMVRDCQIAFREAEATKGQSKTTIVDGTVSAPSPMLSRWRTDMARYAREIFIPFSHWPYRTLRAPPANDDLMVSLPPQAAVKRLVFAKRVPSSRSAKYALQVIDVRRGTVLFTSETVDVSKPFEIVTPLLTLYSGTDPLDLAIQGFSSVEHEMPVGADDFIRLEWA